MVLLGQGTVGLLDLLGGRGFLDPQDLVVVSRHPSSLIDDLVVGIHIVAVSGVLLGCLLSGFLLGSSLLLGTCLLLGHIVLLGTIIAYGYAYASDLKASVGDYYGTALPVVGYILVRLALRGVQKDEELIRSTERFR